MLTGTHASSRNNEKNVGVKLKYQIMSPRLMLKVGFALSAVACLAFWSATHWLNTRTFEPVNLPVTLGTGTVQTVQFEVNLSEIYAIDLQMDASTDDWIPGKCSRALPYSDVSWKIYKIRPEAPGGGSIWAESQHLPWNAMLSDQFQGTPGRYELEWEAPLERLCLNARHPRLSVSTSPWAYDINVASIQFACLILVGPGLMLAARGLARGLLNQTGRRRSLRILPELVLTNAVPVHRHRPQTPIAGIPNFGLLCGCILFIVMFIFMTINRMTSRGLLVHFDKRVTPAWQMSPATETLSVYLDDHRRFWVNGKPIAGEELRQELKDELGKRIVWTVFFEAHENTRFSDSEEAMDTIQSLGAKLVWLTPRTREDFRVQEAR
jgi:biopolymer transport protein ExbD